MSQVPVSKSSLSERIEEGHSPRLGHPLPRQVGSASVSNVGSSSYHTIVPEDAIVPWLAWLGDEQLPSSCSKADLGLSRWFTISA